MLRNRGNDDPFHWNDVPDVRKANGKWANTTIGAFFDGSLVRGVLLAGNHVRNVSQLMVDVNDDRHAMRDNVAYCDPVDIAFDDNNIGIGQLIEPGRGWDYVIEGGDPSVPADYGRVLNWCHETVADNADCGRPAGGKWIEGQIVRVRKARAQGATGSRYLVVAWERMSTGLGNGASDWRDHRVSTGG